jgi:hypothetical protein
MAGEAQCCWLTVKGERTGHTTTNEFPTVYLTAYPGAPALAPVEDGKAYSVRVRATVAAIVSNTGTYGTPSRSFTQGQRYSATLTRSAHVRATGGSFTVFNTETASPPGTAPAVEVIGDASLGLDIEFGGDYIAVKLPTTSSAGPPMNCKVVALVEFQEILFSDFSPNEVSGLRLWLKQDASWADNTALATWGDSSTADSDFEQTASANRPKTFTDVHNGLACVRFDQSGANKQWLVQKTGKDLATLLNDGRAAYTIFVVANWTSTVPGDTTEVRNNPMILADTQGRVGFGFRETSTDPSTISYAQDGTHLQSPARSPRAVNAVQIYTTWLQESFLWAQTAGGNGGLDDGRQDSGTGTTPTPEGQCRLAINYDSAKNTSMDLFEVLFYNRALSIGERMNVIGYLSTKYHLSTN